MLTKHIHAFQTHVFTSWFIKGWIQSVIIIMPLSIIIIYGPHWMCHNSRTRKGSDFPNSIISRIIPDFIRPRFWSPAWFSIYGGFISVHIFNRALLWQWGIFQIDADKITLFLFTCKYIQLNDMSGHFRLLLFFPKNIIEKKIRELAAEGSQILHNLPLKRYDLI